MILAYQMVNLLKRIHSRGLLHRDIKPDNFVTHNIREKYSLALIDFGLSKSFLTSSGSHIPIIYNKALTGTTRYASLNNHAGVEQGRRDDLESAFYIWVYLAKGKLPWQGMKEPKDGHIKIEQMVYNVKKKVSLDSLCEGLPK